MKYVFKKRRYLFLARLFDGAGALLGYPARWGKRLGAVRESAEPKRLLLIRLDHLGDVLNASGLPKLIKEHYPRTEVLFLTSTGGAALLKNDPFIDEILTCDTRWFSRRGKGRCSFAGFMRLAASLRKRGIDTAVGLRGDVRENIFMQNARIKRRIGFGVTGGGFLLTDEAAYRRGAHPVEQMRSLLKLLGITAAPPAPRLTFTDDEREAVSKRLLELGLRTGEKLVGFQIDAGSSAKEWKEEHIVRFVQLFRTHFPQYRLALIGTDAIKARRLQSDHTLNLAGKLSVREMCLVMERFAAFVGADSGPTHIASTLGCPAIFLYSGTNRLDEWRPLAEDAVVLHHPVDCSPCELTVCPVSGHPCMTGIQPESVIAALETKLR